MLVGVWFGGGGGLDYCVFLLVFDVMVVKVEFFWKCKIFV